MDVLRPLGDEELGLAGDLEDLAGAGENLPRDEEGNELLGHLPKIHVPPHQEILVAAVRVAQGVRVVLEDVDLAGKTLLAEPLLGGGQARFQEALARLVVQHQVFDVVALRRGILGMAPGVLVEARAVHEKRVRGPAVGDEPFEDVAEDLLDGKVDPAVR